MSIRTIVVDMPTSIKGYSINSDGFYTIVLNARLDYETNMKSFMHEVQHIQDDDFSKKCDVGLLELFTHI